MATAFASSGEVLLGGGVATLSGSGAITNTGLIRGDGVVNKVVNNNAGGEIRAENGDRLKFAAASGTNAGKINLQGGTAEFAQPLTNGSGGQIEGRGTLITRGTGLTNNGHVGLSSGITDVFGDVNNATGSATKGITISGNADVTFWDDVTNGAGSLFKVSSGSSVTVFGTYSGAGISGNANDIHLEADVSPGFSPATVDFGGNLHFSSTTTLKIELGGTAPGSEYDQVHVSEHLSLGGTLQISLINAPFTPAAGDSFDILDWGALSGTFSTLNLPSLSAGLMWNASQLYTTGVLNVFVAGDYNGNGVVDGADFVVWRNYAGPDPARVSPPTATAAAKSTPATTTSGARISGRPPGAGAARQPPAPPGVPPPPCPNRPRGTWQRSGFYRWRQFAGAAAFTRRILASGGARFRHGRRSAVANESSIDDPRLQAPNGANCAADSRLCDFWASCWRRVRRIPVRITK